MAGAAASQPHHHHHTEFLITTVPKHLHLITNAAALRLADFLRHRFIAQRHRLSSILRSSIKNLPHIDHVLQLEQVWHRRALQLKEFNFPGWPCDIWEATCSSCVYFFGGEGSTTNYGEKGSSYMETPKRHSVNRRQWTNIILALNVLVFAAQIASKGKVLLLGAKINSLIEKGELWRLVTSSFLHANIGHLMVNCYSLNSIGPTMESLSGPRRFLVVYFTSAIASSTMSYWLSKAPAVGASGAIFGLVGSFAIFAMRHNKLVKGGVGDLQYVARVIALNMAIGILSQGIDNWGHLGGLIGGIATSWLIGPAWHVESTYKDGRRVIIDKAPIFSLPGARRPPR